MTSPLVESIVKKYCLTVEQLNNLQSDYDKYINSEFETERRYAETAIKDALLKADELPILNLDFMSKYTMTLSNDIEVPVFIPFKFYGNQIAIYKIFQIRKFHGMIVELYKSINTLDVLDEFVYHLLINNIHPLYQDKGYLNDGQCIYHNPFLCCSITLNTIIPDRVKNNVQKHIDSGKFKKEDIFMIAETTPNMWQVENFTASNPLDPIVIGHDKNANVFRVIDYFDLTTLEELILNTRVED